MIFCHGSYFWGVFITSNYYDLDANEHVIFSRFIFERDKETPCCCSSYYFIHESTL
jgi:hypothetical protein